MSEMKSYTAIQNFSINSDSGKDTFNVKVGDKILFDGLNVEFNGLKSTAITLGKVVGDWVVESSRVKKPIVPVKNSGGQSRNATGGRIVEHSDFTSSPLDRANKRREKNDIDRILEEENKFPEIKLVNGKREVTSDMDDIKREIVIINADDDEVRKVSTVDNAVTNKNSIEIDEQPEKKRVVIFEEGQVAKKTNYPTGISIDEEDEVAPTKLNVDWEAEGDVVKNTDYENSDVEATPKEAKMKVTPSEYSVKKVEQPLNKKIVVGSSTTSISNAPAKKGVPVKSSTSAKVTAAPAKKAAAPAKKGVPVKNATPVKSSALAKPSIIDSNGQEAIVISKVSAIKVDLEDGIESSVHVGSSGEMSIGEAKFSSSNDDITISELE